MSNPELIEDFFGVYLLYCLHPKYKGRTYIGYTRDPTRRIMQHNRGTWAGGAHRTNNKGPWKMVLIVHGFPNNISALRFEWAWQNPSKTVRLQHLDLKRIPRKETEFRHQLRILSEMIRVVPWFRLPLSIRWLEEDFYEQFPDERKPPKHMVICYGPIKSRNLKKHNETSNTINTECLLCSRDITSNNSMVTCLNSNCELIAHLQCLADLFLPPGEYVPIEGVCPFCSVQLKWGDLIRKMKGCSQNYIISDDEQNINDDEQCIHDEDDVIYSQDKGFVDNNSHWLNNFEDDL